MIRCQNCKAWFEPNTHNQIYDTPECRKEATNAKIMKRYYDKKNKVKNKECVNCGTALNMYNDSKYCLRCTKNQHVNNKNILKEIKHGFKGFEE